VGDEIGFEFNVKGKGASRAGGDGIERKAIALIVSLKEIAIVLPNILD
jgi:hypothetical protein